MDGSERDASEGLIVQVEPEVPQLRAREELRRWVRERTKGEAEVDVTELTKEVLRFGPEFLERLGREEAGRIVEMFVGAYLRPSLQTQMLDRPRKLGLTETKAVSIFGGWYEEVSAHRKVSLLKMYVEDLDQAIAIRKSRMAHENRRVSFFSTIRSGMEEGQQVQDAWDPLELADLWRKGEEEG